MLLYVLKTSALPWHPFLYGLKRAEHLFISTCMLFKNVRIQKTNNQWEDQGIFWDEFDEDMAEIGNVSDDEIRMFIEKFTNREKLSKRENCILDALCNSGIMRFEFVKKNGRVSVEGNPDSLFVARFSPPGSPLPDMPAPWAKFHPSHEEKSNNPLKPLPFISRFGL
jgi:hypothetical protein